MVSVIYPIQQITDSPGGHSSFLTILSDGQWVYYLDDKQGDEIGHYTAALVDAKRRSGAKGVKNYG
jgi:hypothetical protein